MEKITTPKGLEAFVKDIFVLGSNIQEKEHKLPFYADGFAGIIYSKSTNPFYLQPKNKKLSNFYLYGQTIEPISLEINGSYKLVCIRMYPFAVRILLGVDPKELNDDCYDLKLIENIDTQSFIEKLDRTSDHNVIVQIIEEYIYELLKNASTNPDYRIKLAINLILKSKGTISIRKLREKLFVTERTLERHFLNEIGINPKQFAKVVQFSYALEKISESDYFNLSEVGYESGFSDQSHFIRTFKRFTGKTPKEFQQGITL